MAMRLQPASSLWLKSGSAASPNDVTSTIAIPSAPKSYVYVTSVGPQGPSLSVPSVDMQECIIHNKSAAGIIVSVTATQILEAQWAPGVDGIIHLIGDLVAGTWTEIGRTATATAGGGEG